MTNFWKPVPLRRVLPALLPAQAGVIIATSMLNFWSPGQLAAAVAVLAVADVLAWLAVHRR
jgi:hypothetical protein